MGASVRTCWVQYGGQCTDLLGTYGGQCLDLLGPIWGPVCGLVRSNMGASVRTC